ncbi:MAG: amidohydrolase [Clostridiales bacterium]|nr:amidohydrolase [Clostridiales bacterium]
MKMLFRNTKILCENENGFEIIDGSIGIDGDRIAFVGEAPEDISGYETVDGKGQLVMPGLINSHTHAYMTVFRNVADDLMFDDWLFGNIMPREDKLLPGDSYWGTMLGIGEMLKSGTTAFLDMYIFTDENVQAVEDSGIRAVMSRGLSGIRAGDEGGNRRLSEAVAEIKKWRSQGNGRITFMLAPHAPYSCAPDYIKEVLECARELNVGIHTHLAESRNEIKNIAETYGCTPVEYMERTGMFDLPTVAAHCVYLTDSDMDIFADKGVSIATNPVSNLKLANGIAPVKKYLDRGINVCLGTDGAASNNCLNMFRDLSFLTLLNKGVFEDPLAVSAEDGLRIATVNGAKALGLENTGSIKAGNKADLIFIDINRLNMFPHNNIISSLAYSANGSEVTRVMVDGKILMENGELKTVDEERVRFEVARIADRINN